DACPALLFAEQSDDRAAANDHHVRTNLAYGRRAADIVLRLIGASSVGAVALGSEPAEDAGGRLRPLFAVLFGGPADCSAISIATAHAMEHHAALWIRPFALEGLRGGSRRDERHGERGNAQEDPFHAPRPSRAMRQEWFAGIAAR